MIRKYPCVLTVTHAHGHNDGCEPVVRHLARKYRPVRIGHAQMMPNPARHIERDSRNRKAETLVAEAAFPMTAGGVCQLAGIPPQSVTHSLLCVDALTVEFDRFGALIQQAIAVSGVTGIALGNVGIFDPASFGARTMDELGERAAALVNYAEQYLGRAVVFLATGPETVIDREPFPAHMQPDKSRVVTVGTPDHKEFTDAERG